MLNADFCGPAMGQSHCLLCVPREDASGEGAENPCTFFPCMKKTWGRRFDLHSHFSFMLLDQSGANGEAAMINSRRRYCGDGWGRGDQVGGKGLGAAWEHQQLECESISGSVAQPLLLRQKQLRVFCVRANCFAM